MCWARSMNISLPPESYTLWVVTVDVKIKHRKHKDIADQRVAYWNCIRYHLGPGELVKFNAKFAVKSCANCASFWCLRTLWRPTPIPYTSGIGRYSYTCMDLYSILFPFENLTVSNRDVPIYIIRDTISFRHGMQHCCRNYWCLIAQYCTWLSSSFSIKHMCRLQTAVCERVICLSTYQRRPVMQILVIN